MLKDSSSKQYSNISYFNDHDARKLRGAALHNGYTSSVFTVAAEVSTIAAEAVSAGLTMLVARPTAHLA